MATRIADRQLRYAAAKLGNQTRRRFFLDAAPFSPNAIWPDAIKTSKVAAAIRRVDVALTSSGALPPISSNDGFR